MKKLIYVLAPVLAAAPMLAASLAPSDRDRALAELNASRQQFLDSVAGLSPAQWNFKPDEKTWSVFECAEHIALSEDLIFGGITQWAKGPATPDKKSAVTDDFILKAVVNRTQKFQAPEPLQPKHKFATPDELLEHFKA